MRKFWRVIRIILVAALIFGAVAIGETYALRSVRKAFDQQLFRDAMNSASVMLVACRMVYDFQVLREIEREQLLIEAAQKIPEGEIEHNELVAIREAGKLPLVLLTDEEGQILGKSGALMADTYTWMADLRDKLAEVYHNGAEIEIYGIDREFPLTEEPKVLAVRVDNGVVVLFAPEPTIREREELTVGKMISYLGENPNVRYITLQDEGGFIFATKSVTEMTSLTADSFLAEVHESGIPRGRFVNFSGDKVYELAAKFPTMGLYRGVLRIGLSTNEYQRLLNSFSTQLAIILLLVLAVTVVGVVLLFTTQRLSAQKGLSEAILSEMSALCAAVDRDGVITLLNPVTAKVYGVKQKDAIGKLVEDVLPGDPFRLVETLRTGSGSVFAEELQIGDKLFHLDVSTGILSDGGAFAVAENITNLLELRKEAAGAEHLRALGELTAGVAHEIRNPLNAIGIAAQMLSSDFAPKEDEEGYRELLRNVRVEITRLDKVVREFIGLSAPMAPDLKRRPLAPILEEIAEAAKLRAAGKHIEFTTSFADVGIAAFDEEQLKKALLNLIKNAVEATPEFGEIRLSAEIREENVRIEIWDDGPPIPANIREKLGKPFVSSGKEGGTGIGLFLAFRIARDHGGKIEVESNDSGTSFTFILPTH